MNFKTPITRPEIPRVKMPKPASEEQLNSSSSKRPSLFPLSDGKNLTDKAIEVLESQLVLDRESFKDGAEAFVLREAKNSLEILRLTTEKNSKCLSVLARTSADHPFPEIRKTAKEILSDHY
ncbi:hypothetical protein JXA56_04550 [Candidatus Micrarchaeota archaeon]|nr:hypothetical protein [Candidatus Micrarchaeota archaeon]